MQTGVVRAQVGAVVRAAVGHRRAYTSTGAR